MKRTALFIASLLTLCITFMPSAACAQQTKAQSSQAQDASQQEATSAHEPSAKFNYFFQEAIRQRLLQHYDAAIDLANYCHTLDPQSGAALYELATLYRYANNDSLATDALEKASALYPNNFWYKSSLVMRYLSNNRTDEALAKVEELAKQFPEKTDVLAMLLDLYEKKNDYANMVKVLDKIEMKEGKSEQLSMDKFRIFLQMNDEKRAFEEMKSLADEYPNDLRYQVVIGDLYLDAGRKDDAMKQYKAVEAIDSTNVTLQLSLSNYYEHEGNDSLYRKYLTRLMTNPGVDDDARLRMMAVVVKENLDKNADSTFILNLFDKVLQQPQTNVSLIELRVRYMVTRDMPHKDIRPYLYKMLDIDPENNTARQQLLAYAVEEKDTISILNICKPAIDYKSDDPIFYYYLGISYIMLNEPQKALGALKAGLPRVEKSTSDNKLQMTSNIYGMLGDIYHQLGNDDKAFQAYDSCLVYTQSDATVLNNYAYYLSLKKKDLNKAEEMSRRSNELEPNNSTYLDTYAWVLYQLKRYEEAKDIMDKAVEIMQKEEEEPTDDVLMHIKKINKKSKK